MSYAAPTSRGLVLNAADLLSEERENPEYDRAIVELVANTLGLGTEAHERQVIEVMLRALRA